MQIQSHSRVITECGLAASCAAGSHFLIITKTDSDAAVVLTTFGEYDPDDEHLTALTQQLLTHTVTVLP